MRRSRGSRWGQETPSTCIRLTGCSTPCGSRIWICARLTGAVLAGSSRSPASSIRPLRW
ncbi:hypothetical protein ACH4MG_00500 [Streptomyces sp. NPDC017454]|uniref:hypothetical protein n=1 Tax=Streptomyces sp. NPDC017454 TaxID=3364997 RepID=UPI0037975335